LDDTFGPFTAFTESYGFIPNFFRAQALLPRLIEGQAGLEAAIVLNANALSRLRKEQILLLVAVALQDVYWVTVRAAVLLSLGVSASEIDQLLGNYHQARVSAAELAQFDFCVKLAASWPAIGLEDVERLRAHGFEDAAIVETVQTCALARFLCVLSAGLRPVPDREPYKLNAKSQAPARLSETVKARSLHSVDKKPYVATIYLSPTSFAPFASVLKTHGFIPNVYRVQSLRPDVLIASSANMRNLLVPNDVLTRRQKECIFVAVSAVTLNSYCVAAHCNLLRGMGLTPDEGDQIAMDHRHSNLSEGEKSLLDFAVKLALRPEEICSRDIDNLRALGFSDEQILECEAIAALSNYVNMIQIGLGAEPDFDLPPGYDENKVYLSEILERHIAEAPEALAPAKVPPLEDPDAELVVNAQAGDLGSFETLIRRHSSTVYRVLMAILGNPDEAQDAMQDALMSAFKHIGGFQRRSRFSTWLVSIARNTALQRLRDRKNVESLDEAGEGEEEFRPRQIRAWQDDPEQLHSKGEIRDLVEKGILGLPVKYRVVVMLRDIEQLSTEEVARQLGLGVPATKARLQRGRLMLREALAPHFAAAAGKAAL
jgi:RNA polymerase sigma-70 factor (ECF subfamily)